MLRELDGEHNLISDRDAGSEDHHMRIDEFNTGERKTVATD